VGHEQVPADYLHVVIGQTRWRIILGIATHISAYYQQVAISRKDGGYFVGHEQVPAGYVHVVIGQTKWRISVGIATTDISLL
jgi:hypothetical protein